MRYTECKRVQETTCLTTSGVTVGITVCEGDAAKVD